VKHVIDMRYGPGIRWFLANGADPNAVHPLSGESAFHWGVKRGLDEATLELLLDHGADPNALRGAASEIDERDRSLVSLVSLVSHVGQLGTAAGVRLLIQHGFDGRARGWMNATALHWGACRGHAAIIDVCLEAGLPAEDVGGTFGTPLHTAKECRWVEGGDYDAVIARLE